MGVPTFYKWICVRYPKVVGDAVENSHRGEIDAEVGMPCSANDANPNGAFDCLYLDMNGIIHPCSHPEDGEEPKSEEEMFLAIFRYIDRLFSIVRPRKLLYMAIDGVAPRAKMNQQRMRRYKAAKEAEVKSRLYEEIRAQFEKDGRVVPAQRGTWDSNVITPGTPFMEKLAEALRWYAHDRLARNVAWQGVKVLLSDANTPGEGEHKIMTFIRAQRNLPDYDPNTVHCLHGMDADLIMLGLATHEARFYILREIVTDETHEKKCGLCGKLGHYGSECHEGCSSNPHAKAQAEADARRSAADAEQTLDGMQKAWKPLQFLRLPILRQYLSLQLSFKETPLPFQYDFERCLDDFIFMCFFVGNDFLPHLPSLSIHKGSIDAMILLYQKILPSLGDYLTNAGEINFEQAQRFVKHLGNIEDEVFKSENRRKEIQDRRRADDIAARDARLQRDQALKKNEPGPPPSRKRLAPDSLGQAPAKKHVTESETGGVDANLRAAQALQATLFGEAAAPPVDEEDETLISESSDSVVEELTKKRFTHEENIDDFRAKLAKALKEEEEKQIIFDEVKLGVGNITDWRPRYYSVKFHLTDEDTLEDFAAQVAGEYVLGMRWVLQYYYQGSPSWGWFYPFHYAPFASDLALHGFSTVRAKSQFVEGEPFRPFEQLMSVLPPRSSFAIPCCFASLMTAPDSPLLDFYPESFRVDPDGKKLSWLHIILLPFIDQDRLQKVLRRQEHLLTPEETRRNTLRKEILFVHRTHPLFAQISQKVYNRDILEASAVKANPLDSSSGDGEHASKNGGVAHAQLAIDTVLSDGLGGSLLPLDRPSHPGERITGFCSLVPSIHSQAVECAYVPMSKVPHACKLLPGATEPDYEVDEYDVQPRMDSERRFAGLPAKRMIYQSLGITLPSYLGRRGGDREASNANGFHAQLQQNNYGADNPYQREMFGMYGQKTGVAPLSVPLTTQWVADFAAGTGRGRPLATPLGRGVNPFTGAAITRDPSVVPNVVPNVVPTSRWGRYGGLVAGDPYNHQHPYQDSYAAGQEYAGRGFPGRSYRPYEIANHPYNNSNSNSNNNHTYGRQLFSAQPRNDGAGPSGLYSYADDRYHDRQRRVAVGLSEQPNSGFATNYGSGYRGGFHASVGRGAGSTYRGNNGYRHDTGPRPPPRGEGYWR